MGPVSAGGESVWHACASGGAQNPSDLLAAVRQPDCYTIRIASAVRIEKGESILVGVFTPDPKTHAGKRVLLTVFGHELCGILVKVGIKYVIDMDKGRSLQSHVHESGLHTR